MPESFQQSYLRPAPFPYPGAIAVDQAALTSEAARQIVGKVVALCRPRRPAHTFRAVADQEIGDLLQECREHLERQEGPPESPPLDENEQLFDTFFGIVRHGSPDALAIAAAWGLLTLIQEVRRPHGLVPAELTALARGFFRFASPFLPRPQFDFPAGLSEHVSPASSEAPLAFERWKNGHLLFVSLTDGLILTHLEAIAAIERHAWDEAAKALRDAGHMLTASAVAMRLAGDMTSDEYDEVRSRMSPPHVPRPLSGLFNSDHRRLLQATKRLGVHFQQSTPELAWAREEYWFALNDAYSGHRWVCQQLVRGAPSISGQARGSERPAYEEIEGFAKRALYFAGGAQRPIRKDSTSI